MCSCLNVYNENNCVVYGSLSVLRIIDVHHIIGNDHDDYLHVNPFIHMNDI